MGLGRRDFLKLFGVAISTISAQSINSAIAILDDTYVNRKLGIAFQKPVNWYFNNIQEMGEVAQGQILDLADAELARKIISKADLPFASISQEKVSITSPYEFTPGINVFIEIRDQHVRQKSKYSHLFDHIKEPYRTVRQDIFSNQRLLKDFAVLSAETMLQISNCQAIQYGSSFRLEHRELASSIQVRLNTLLVIQNDFWYTFRMYDAPSLGIRFIYDYSQFVDSIVLV